MNKRLLVVVGRTPGKSVGRQIRYFGSETLAVAEFAVEIEAENNLDFLGMLDELQVIIQQNHITDVLIVLHPSMFHRMREIVASLENLPTGVWIVQDTFKGTPGTEKLDATDMINLRASAINGYQRMFKRAFDLTLSLLLLVPALPLIGMLSLLILLEDGTPAIFRQKRVGERGRIFEMLKFRTMMHDAEKLRSQIEAVDEDGNLIYKMKNDPRITRMGRFLRRFSLDELPQLFNILAGTMSLVGPRPEMPYLVDRYQPWQWQRFTVPPGLTGWWQVSGRSERPMHLHTEDDLYYIQNYSIWLDLKILFRTVWAVLEGRGSY